MTTPPLLPASVWIGLDVAKDKLDACLVRPLGKPQSKVFANTHDGFAKLQRWVAHLAGEALVHYALESTGGYERAVATFLAEAGARVSLLNPARVAYAARAYGHDTKTDPVAAYTLAEFCRKEQPPLWRQATPEGQHLLALSRRCEDVQRLLTAEKNRQQQPGLLPTVAASLEQTIGFLQGELTRLQQQMHDHIDNTPSLRADKEFLTSIPGIGDRSAGQILAELPDLDLFAQADQLAAYAGLAPRQHQSGTSVHKPTRLSKTGNARLRKALFYPALTAIRFNPLLRAQYERLVAAGKCKKAALAAAMRKLLVLVYGVLKHRANFDANWTSKPPKAA